MMVWRVFVAAFFVASCDVPANDAPSRDDGAWHLRVHRDMMTDVETRLATLDGVGGTFGLICANRSTNPNVSVAFIANRYLGGNLTRRRIVYRFDSDRPVETNWQYQERSAVNATAQPARRFLARLEQANVLSARLFDDDGNEIDMMFPDLRGTTEAINWFREGCER